MHFKAFFGLFLNRFAARFCKHASAYYGFDRIYSMPDGNLHVF